MIIDFLQHITSLDILLIGVIFVAFAYELFFYVRYMAGVSRKLRRDAKAAKVKQQTQEKEQIAETTKVQPPVSVVVCAHNEAENLDQFLVSVLDQNYPEFEVIVVDDGSEDHTQEILAQYALRYPKLHLTFVPAEARLRSSKKLALTLAAKASQYDYLLLTDADCRPASPNWISEMMKGFANEQTEVVIGFGAYFEEPTIINHIIEYDTLFNGLQYLGLALARHPYMGVGRNLAYKKSTFFDHKGFAGLLGCKAGDDDLFVNKVATRNNTAVVCSPESLTLSIPKTNYKEWNQQKYRHLSVSPNYKFGTKVRLTAEPAIRGIFYLALIACSVWGSWLVALAAIALFLIRLMMQMIIINTSARKLLLRPFGLGIIFYDIFFPLNSLFKITKQHFFPRNNDVW